MADGMLQSLTAFLWSTGAFVVAIAVLVAVHEFGHFWVARKLGVKVLRFSIGFGKALWSRTDSAGCEYVVATIPLGGYVKMLDEREAPVAETELHASFNRQPVWKRCAIVLAGPAANFLLAMCLFFGLFFGDQQSFVPVVGKVTPDSPAAHAGLQQGQEIVAVDGVATSTRAAVLDALLARMQSPAMAERPPQIERAIHNFKMAVHMRLARAPWTDTQAHEFAAVLDAAAQNIEKI